MKFTAKNIDVQNWLQPAIIVSTVGVQSDYPDTGHMTICVTANGLVASANNGNAAIVTKPSTTSDAVFTTEGSVTINAADLQNSLIAFEDDAMLIFELKGNEFSITVDKDADQTMSLPIDVRTVVVPEQANTFNKEAKIKRDTFIRLMNKVIFAIGYEERKPEFLYWMLRLEPNKARSVCGNGNRFSVYEIEGKDLFETQKSLNVAIYREHNGILVKLLPLQTTDSIIIREYLRSKDDDPFLNQTVIELDSSTLMLLGHNPGVKWIDENKYLLRNSTNRFVTQVSSLDGAIKSVRATINKDVKQQHQFHWTFLDFDADAGTVNINSSLLIKANRKSKISDGNGKVTFKCLSKFLIEVCDLAEPDSYLQWEFDDNKGPLIVKFNATTKVSTGALEQVNISTGVKESHTIFFAAFNK